MAETSGSGSEVETWYTYVVKSGREGLYKTDEDIGNSDTESFDFDLTDEETYLLSHYPSDLDFYDQKHGRISRRNGVKKLSSGKARFKTSPAQSQTDQNSVSSSKHSYNGVGVKRVCSVNKESRIKEARIENAKKKKENKAKSKKVRVQTELPVVRRGGTKRTDHPSCLKKTESESVKPPTFYNNSDFVLSSGNSVKFVDQAFMNLLVELQNRDITPEDYDLLVQLDSSVKPKTLSEAQIYSLRSDTVASILDDVCNICIEDYTPGEERKFLPCGHYFHGQCIRTWLSWTSNRCPIDGREVR